MECPAVLEVAGGLRGGYDGDYVGSLGVELVIDGKQERAFPL